MPCSSFDAPPPPAAGQEIAVAVVRHKDRYLVGRRSADVALGGYAEFPGGKMEPGEGAVQAALRECREETGIDAVAVGRYDDVVHQYSAQQAAKGQGEAFTVRIHFVACRPAAGSLAEPHAPFGWVSAAALSRLAFPAANSQLIRQLMVETPPRGLEE